MKWQIRKIMTVPAMKSKVRTIPEFCDGSMTSHITALAIITMCEQYTKKLLFLNCAFTLIFCFSINDETRLKKKTSSIMMKNRTARLKRNLYLYNR